MKVLYITNGINGAGGLERVISIKASYLAEQHAYDVQILCLNNGGDNPFYSFSDKIKMRSIAVGGHPIHYIAAYKKGIRSMVKSIKPDVILVCDDGLKGFFIPALLGSRIPIVYERHVSKEIEMNEAFSFLKKIIVKVKWRLMEQMAAQFAAFVVLTNGNLNEWPSLKNKIVIPNPLSFYPKEASTLTNKKVIVVGKQGYQKGYDRLLNAWKLVHEKQPNWQLEIYGSIAPEFALQEQADTLGIATSVHFYPPVKDIQTKYLEASIYAMSSRFEGFGMVLIEAMACGLPCISFDCKYGPADIIQNGVDGYVIKNGDVEALSNAINHLIEDENLLKAMGQQAKENVKRYLPEKIMPQWDNLFKRLLA